MGIHVVSIEIAESFKTDTALPTNTVIFKGNDNFETARIMEYAKMGVYYN